jgi:hypothetical protein
MSHCNDPFNEAPKGENQATKAEYLEHLLAEQLAADQWLIDNESELSECPEQSYGERQGYESQAFEGETDQATCPLNAIFDQLAKEDIAGGYWEDSIIPDSLVEEAGKFNVTPLAHWKGSVTTCKQTGDTTGNKFVPVSYSRHQKLALKNRSQFGIGFCYYEKNNNVRQALPSKSEVQTIRTDKVSRKLKALAKLQARIANK